MFFTFSTNSDLNSFMTSSANDLDFLGLLAGKKKKNQITQKYVVLIINRVEINLLMLQYIYLYTRMYII